MNVDGAVSGRPHSDVSRAWLRLTFLAIPRLASLSPASSRIGGRPRPALPCPTLHHTPPAARVRWRDIRCVRLETSCHALARLADPVPGPAFRRVPAHRCGRVRERQSRRWSGPPGSSAGVAARGSTKSWPCRRGRSTRCTKPLLTTLTSLFVAAFGSRLVASANVETVVRPPRRRRTSSVSFSVGVRDPAGSASWSSPGERARKIGRT